MRENPGLTNDVPDSWGGGGVDRKGDRDSGVEFGEESVFFLHKSNLSPRWHGGLSVDTRDSRLKLTVFEWSSNDEMPLIYKPLAEQGQIPSICVNSRGSWCVDRRSVAEGFRRPIGDLFGDAKMVRIRLKNIFVRETIRRRRKRRYFLLALTTFYQAQIQDVDLRVGRASNIDIDNKYRLS